MPPKAFKHTSKVAQFISRRIDELRPRRSQSEIATAAGFPSVNMLSMIKDGKVKLPMDRVIPLANALECDPSTLARMALEQLFAGTILGTILSLSDTKSEPVERNDMHAAAITLSAEVQATLRDVKFCAQYVRNATSRMARIEDGMVRMKRAMDELMVESSASR